MDDGGGDELGALVERCATGDRAAFRALYDLEGGRLYGIALRLTGDAALAADAVHDTLLQLWRNALRFDPARGSAGAWLATMLRYRAIDAKRRTAREDRAAVLPDRADDAPDALATLVRSDAARALRACIDGLDPAQRRAVVMAFFDGLSHGELALRLGAPLGTVKSAVRRGLLALRRCLEGGRAA